MRKGSDPKRVAKILKILDATYPRAECALEHRNAWQLLVATILSAQCTDVRVNKVTPELFRKYPTAGDFAALRQETLEQDIDRKSTRLNSSHIQKSRMPSSA